MKKKGLLDVHESRGRFVCYIHLGKFDLTLAPVTSAYWTRVSLPGYLPRGIDVIYLALDDKSRKTAVEKS